MLHRRLRCSALCLGALCLALMIYNPSVGQRDAEHPTDGDRRVAPVTVRALDTNPKAGVSPGSRQRRRALSGASLVIKKLELLEHTMMGHHAESAAAEIHRKPGAATHHGNAAAAAAAAPPAPGDVGAAFAPKVATAAFAFRPHMGSPNLTVFSDADVERLYALGCPLLDQGPSEADVEAMQQNRSLRFALLYSGQVCHGRGANVLHHPALMRDLWANHATYVHAPLTQWGTVALFGLFEEMSPAAITALTHTAAGPAQASGCNDFGAYANWTQLEFMPSARSVRHGEERRVEALKRFVGLAR